MWLLLISKESINNEKCAKFQPCLPDTLECDSLTKVTNSTTVTDVTPYNVHRVSRLTTVSYAEGEIIPVCSVQGAGPQNSFSNPIIPEDVV